MCKLTHLYYKPETHQKGVFEAIYWLGSVQIKSTFAMSLQTQPKVKYLVKGWGTC